MLYLKASGLSEGGLGKNSKIPLQLSASIRHYSYVYFELTSHSLISRVIFRPQHLFGFHPHDIDDAKSAGEQYA